jgi:hypothetical protein
MKTIHNFNSNVRLDKICSTDDLRPVFERIYFKDGFAYATDTHVIVKVNVKRISSFSDEEIGLLDGKLLHKNAYKELLKFGVAKIEADGITGIGSYYSALFKFHNEDYEYPNTDAIFNRKDGSQKIISEVISFDPALLKNIMFAFPDERYLQLSMENTVHGIICRPYNDDLDGSIAVLMPALPKGRD